LIASITVLKTSRKLFYLLLASILLVAAACSGDGEDPTSTLPATATATPTETPELTDMPESTEEPSQTSTDNPPVFGIGFDEDGTGPLEIRVAADSPADEAGLMDGDVITAINGEEVDQSNLRETYSQYRPGDTITVDVLRDDETLSFDVTLIARPDVETPQAVSVTQPFLGVVMEVGEETVTVQEVFPGSVADEAGIAVGDVINVANDIEIDPPQVLYDTVQELLPGSQLTLEIERDDVVVNFDVVLGDPVDPEAAANSGMESVTFEDNVWIINNAPLTGVLGRLGLMNGDVITAINGEVLSPDELIAMIPETTPDDVVTLTIERDGETMEMETGGVVIVALGASANDITTTFNQRPQPGTEAPELVPPLQEPFGANNPTAVPPFTVPNTTAVAPELPFATQGSQNLFGMVLTDAEEGDGVLVETVIPGSDADQAEIQQGDLIVAVNGEEITDLESLIDEIGGILQTLTFTIDRDDEEIELVLEPFIPDSGVPPFLLTPSASSGGTPFNPPQSDSAPPFVTPTETDD